VGRADVSDLDVSKIQISLNSVLIAENGGRAASYTEEQGQIAMQAEDIEITIQLNRGHVSETLWTTDLSYEYVRINAEYRT
ncbi:MAG: bifunctional ornithine acetyltransferase/N-acetylglutamate synthase, partial [Porticoccaceae bacterium]